MQKLAGQPFQQGQHICAVYDTPEEQLAIAACYIADGLQRDERCLYVAASDDSLDCFRTSLRALGVDVDATEQRTALLLRTSDHVGTCPGLPIRHQARNRSSSTKRC